MKLTNETIQGSDAAPSRAWADGLCDRLQRLARCFAFWDAAVDHARGMHDSEVRGYYGIPTDELIMRREYQRRQYLDANIEEKAKE